MTKAWKKEYISQVNARRAALGESRLTRAQASYAIVCEAKARALKAVKS